MPDVTELTGIPPECQKFFQKRIYISMISGYQETQQTQQLVEQI